MKVKVLIVIFHALVRKHSLIFTDIKEKYLSSLMKEDEYELLHFKQACEGTLQSTFSNNKR